MDPDCVAEQDSGKPKHWGRKAIKSVGVRSYYPPTPPAAGRVTNHKSQAVQVRGSAMPSRFNEDHGHTCLERLTVTFVILID